MNRSVPWLIAVTSLATTGAALAQPAPSPSALPVTTATLPEQVTPLAPTETEFPFLAGFHNDLFYIASRNHDFFIAPSGRLQVDGVLFAGDRITEPSASGQPSPVRDQFLLRRARIEMFGGFLDRFTFMLGADFALTNTPIATDCFINARAHPLFNVQIGQFDAPFTLENRTSDRYFDFIERSLAVRGLGIPTNKELGMMAWGEDERRIFYYSIGVFDGDGQNRLNRDNYFDVMGRVFGHPFMLWNNPLKDLQVGASFWYGWRGPTVDYAYPNIATTGGFTLFNTTLPASSGGLTIVPDGEQMRVASELVLPIRRFDLHAEVVYVHNGTAEVPTNALGSAAQRLGVLSGVGYYVQFGYWIWGTPGVNGRPGYENPASLQLSTPDPAEPPQGIEVLARFESLDYRYDGGVRGSIAAGGQAQDGRYLIYVAELGVNYWATKHVRFSLNYLQYFFPDQPAAGLTDPNLMHGPSYNAFTYGELLVRAAIAI